MTKTTRSTKQELATIMLPPALNTGSLQAGLLVGGSREATEIVQAVAQQVHSNRVRQAASAAQAEQAERLSNALTLHTEQHFDDYMQAEIALRDRPRDERTQADFEAFAKLLRQQQANSLLAIRNAAVNAIESTAAEPVHVPSPSHKEIVISEEPSGIAKFFGAHTKTTRIPR